MVWFKNKKIILSILLTAVCLTAMVGLVQAQTPPPDLGIDEVGEALGQPATDIRLIVARIIRSALGLLGIVVVVIMLYAGFIWMTAGGNEENITRAKKMMLNAVIGLAIILSAYSIVSFVMNKLVEATTGVTTGTQDGGPGSDPYFPNNSNSFFITSLPLGGDLCIRNVKLVVGFNRSVDLNSLNGNLVVQRDNNNVNGVWKYGGQENVAVFEPIGDCAPDTGNDCLLANTEYSLEFANNINDIKSKDNPALPLIGCLNSTTRLVNTASCTNVIFTTGEGVDRTPPSIHITYPDSSSALKQGDVVPVQVDYFDDFGLQNLILSADNNFVNSVNISGCQRTGIVSIDWPTNAIPTGLHLLNVLGTDWSALTDSKSVSVNLRPDYCFDGILNNNEDRIDCEISGVDSGCGLCEGSACTDDSQCSSGFCNIPSGESEGVCLDRTQITRVSPISGAPGTYVTISGYYFGNEIGRVYFPRVANPSATNPANWVSANIVNCGASVDNWISTQILVEVPTLAVSGPIRVETAKASTAPVDQAIFYKDATNDGWGPVLADFTVNNQVRPGICALLPDRELPNAKISLSGKMFGALDNGTDDQVYFGDTKAVVLPNEWADTLVQATVPNLAPSAVGVKIMNNGIESNSVKFTILSGEDTLDPIITGITPRTGARGDYLTIEGKNFGNSLGRVWFKLGAVTANGSFAFPADCSNSVWSDTKIIVKFPNDISYNLGQYVVQVNTAQNRTSAYNPGINFSLVGGEPRPGLCKITPGSGPINTLVNLTGEYFGTNIQNLNTFFWLNGASATEVTGRLLVTKDSSYTLSRTADNLGSILTAKVPDQTNTGPVIIQRVSDSKISNPLNYTVSNCVENNNQCDEGSHCCSNGTCLLDGELCAGETRSTGYVWRFSTREIPQAPRVVENCSVTSAGLLTPGTLPTPSPNISLWGNDSSRVCRSALVIVEFSHPIRPSSITSANDSVVVRKCSERESTNICVDPEEIVLRAESFVLKTASQDENSATQYLEIYVDDEDDKWDDNTWYQVVLTKNIIGDDADNMPLLADKPCNMTNSAYCFMFRTGAEECRMAGAVVTPYSFWTKVLENIIKVRPFDSVSTEINYPDLYYRGRGLSDLRCIMMEDDANWTWNSSNVNYSVPTNLSGHVTRASALANTVGIGLNNPRDAVKIQATAVIGQIGQVGYSSFSAFSPLTIDLSEPKIIGFWPNCLEACPDAEVGVLFNTTMSNVNLGITTLDLGPIRFFKCLDENCLNTTTVNFTLSTNLENREIIINPSPVEGQESPLLPNTIYGVVVTASTSPNHLWSAATLSNLSSTSKPVDQEFVWRFRTKAQNCLVDRVVVNPVSYSAVSLTDRKVYSASAFSAPDSCSKDGQKINPWTKAWDWTSSDTLVAEVEKFTTVGRNENCTFLCVKKGSDVPYDSEIVFPICGNGIKEAGEDCDAPNRNKNCGLNCLNLGSTDTALCGNGLLNRDTNYATTGYGEECDPTDNTTKVGCSAVCTNLGSPALTSATAVGESICGNGTVGSGEDCDWGIAKDPNDPKSAYGCSEKCIHTGSVISSKWCQDNISDRGGFTVEEYEQACAQSISICGNGITEPDEDAGCDVGLNDVSSDCNDFCLLEDSPYEGSSLLNDTPSVCGNGVVEPGEDPYCENDDYFTVFYNQSGGFDPWALTRGLGGGDASGEPPALRSNITASVAIGNSGVRKSGSGEFLIRCGYQNDAECQDRFGSEFAVGNDTCCHLKPQLRDVYPPTSTPGLVCLNTFISAVFNGSIDGTTLNENVLLARGVPTADCPSGSTKISTIPLALNDLDDQNLPWYKKIFNRLARFFSFIFGEKTSAAPAVGSWCVGLDRINSSVNYNSVTNLSEIKVKLATLLAPDTHYAVILKDGIKDTNGVSIGKEGTNDIYWRFITGFEVCQVDKVLITPPEHYFSRAGSSYDFTAEAISTNHGRVQSIAEVYDWDYLWGPPESLIMALSPIENSPDMIKVTSANRNGEQDITATINITANTINGLLGPTAVGNSHITVFLCENPWPPKDYFSTPEAQPVTIFPFEDKTANNDGYGTDNKFNNTVLPASTAGGYFNFKTYYCADNGVTGVGDDLPYLRTAVQGTATTPLPVGTLKRFIFTDANPDNADAIGIQIFSNPEHLSVKDWYGKEKGFVGDMRSLEVDGYEAITDGNNIYVDSLNTIGETESDRKIYSNIYLFSINSNAKPEMRKVFEQIINNLKFNINLVNNYHYCGDTSDDPDTDQACENDNDCPDGKVCSAEKDKLKRNYKRLRTLQTIKNNLHNFSTQNNGLYPELAEGTFLSGQVVSTWPSWSMLSSAVGKNMPVDPINRLSPVGTCKNNPNIFCKNNLNCPTGDTCLLHDAITGWSDVDRRFSFACSTSSFAYRYKFPEAEGIDDYVVRARLERPFDAVNSTAIPGSESVVGSWNNFIKEFIDTDHFTVDDGNGICFPGETITTFEAGRCGDNVVNLGQGEQCDPPDTLRYGECNNNTVTVDKCVNCQWEPQTPTDCSVWSVCGNGVVEAGEDCDAGGLNGMSGSGCDENCAVAVNKCGNTVKDDDELCDWNATIFASVNNQIPPVERQNIEIDNVLKLKYDTFKDGSCNWDCKTYGPYCGDGLVQTKYAESCEEGESCVLNGVSGTRVCYDNCRMKTSAIGWWKFEDENQVGRDYAWNFNDATCPSGVCPTQIDGKVGKGITFSGSSNYYRVTYNVSNSITFNEFTIAGWFKVPNNVSYSGTGVQYPNAIFEGSVSSPITLFTGTNQSNKITHLYFKSRNNFGESTIALPQSYNVGEWHHIAVTVGSEYDDTINNIKYYSDGNLIDKANILLGFYDGSGPVIYSSAPTFNIGRSLSSGGLDELAIYDKALTQSEIQDLLQNGSWDCDNGGVLQVVDDVPLGGCGDGIVQQNTEACDLGTANGIACIPGYNRSCTYCSADCRDVVTVSPTDYCGNGEIDEISPGVDEECDFDPSGSTFVQGDIIDTNGNPVPICETDPSDNTYYLGDKECANDCTALVSHCVACGEDPNGVTVAGSITNVLEPRDTSPLGTGGRVDLAFETGSESIPVGSDTTETEEYEINNIGGDPLCSASTYKLSINGDTAEDHKFEFPVSTQPFAGQYDLILSPVIPADPVVSWFISPVDGTRDTVIKDYGDNIRVVVKWMGEPSAFQGGFMYPLENGSSIFEGGVDITSSTREDYEDFQNHFKGVWWHDLYSLTNTHGETFTIRTASSVTKEIIKSGTILPPIGYKVETPPVMTNEVYAFYVRSFLPIDRYINTAKLRVEVYLPDTDTNLNHFDKPDRIFELKADGTDSDVIRSANPDAKYWHVFNLLRENLSTDVPGRVYRVVDANEQALDNGVIITGASEFTFKDLPCTPNTIGTNVCGADDGCGDSYDTCVGDKICDSSYACNCPVGTIECVANSGVCSAIKTGLACNDGNACTTGEKYQDACGLDCSGGVVTICNDSNACTADSCNSSTGACSYVSSDPSCRPCSTDANCNDSNACTTDTCSAGRCVYTNKTNGTSCTDSNACNGLETCQNGVCSSGTPPNCNDSNSCTDDSCNVSSGCINTPVSGCQSCTTNLQCSDGNDCNGLETCNLTTLRCVAGTTVLPICPSASTVVCGVNITPTNNCGSCTGTGTLCSGGKVCTSGFCVCPTGTVECPSNPGVCQATKIGLACDDGNACTTGEKYQDACGTICSGGTAVAPICPLDTAVNCGTLITPTNGCGTCTGTGSKCAINYTCTSGICRENCTNYCTAGTTRCTASNSVETCRDLNSDGCFEWDTATPVACSESGYCLNGICLEPTCGNRIKEKGEECDGSLILSCSSYNSLFVSGFISCSLDCTYNTYSCVPVVPTINTNGISPYPSIKTGWSFSINGNNFGSVQNDSYVSFTCVSGLIFQKTEVTTFSTDPANPGWTNTRIQGMAPNFNILKSTTMNCDIRVHRRNINNSTSFSVSAPYSYTVIKP